MEIHDVLVICKVTAVTVNFKDTIILYKKIK